MRQQAHRSPRTTASMKAAFSSSAVVRSVHVQEPFLTCFSGPCRRSEKGLQAGGGGRVVSVRHLSFSRPVKGRHPGAAISRERSRGLKGRE
jgi:hypothetical protein